jgi:hypothetical protein
MEVSYVKDVSMRYVGLLRTVAAAFLAFVFIATPMLSAFDRVAWSAPDISRFFVYFPLSLVTDVYLLPVEYIVPATTDPAREAIEAFIAGLPDYIAKASGMMVVSLPKQTEVLDITVEHGVCTVDFSGDIRGVSVGAAGEMALLYAMVETLCQFDHIDSVRILIDGEAAETLAGHVDTSQPLGKDQSDIRRFITFPDAAQHWGGGAISILQISDIVSGYPDGTFQPHGILTRAEFLKMLVEAARLPHSGGAQEPPPFDDVEAHWCHNYVQRALDAGLISVQDYGNSFGPDELLSREEACYLLVKASDVYLANHPDLVIEAKQTVLGFKDEAEIQDKYVEAVRECAKRGFVQGYPDGTFQPKATLTRAEACAILTRMQGVQGDRVLLVGPKPGFRWDGSHVFAVGFATAFEANVNWRVRTASGVDVIPENCTAATNGLGWGAFGLCIDARLLDSAEPMDLEIYLIDMKDGAEYSLVSVPLAR